MKMLLLAIMMAMLTACSSDESSSGPDEPCFTPPEGCAVAWIAETCRCYATIQEAITRAESGQTAIIAAGTFFEPIVVDRPIVLLGMGVGRTILMGVDDETGNIVSIRSSNGASLASMTIHNPYNGTAVFAYDTVTANLRIQACEIIGEVVDFSTGMLFEGCTVRATGGRASIAYYGYGFDTTIRGNDIQSSFIAYSFVGMGGLRHVVEGNSLTGYSWTVELHAADGVNLLSNTITETSGNYGTCVFLSGDARGPSLIAGNGFARSGPGYDIGCFMGSDQRMVTIDQPGAAIDPDCSFTATAAMENQAGAKMDWQAIAAAKKQEMIRRNADGPPAPAVTSAGQDQPLAAVVR